MHREKKQILLNNNSAASDNDFVASFDDLGVDELADILEFLTVKDIMCSRRINKKLMEAVRNTVVPPTDFLIDRLDNYNAMRVMTRAMPNLQQISLKYLGIELGGSHKWSDGEDPNEEEAVRSADYRTHDIEIISNFRKLTYLAINDRHSTAALNGRYPVFFNFPLLQKLSLQYCRFLKWDLEMLAGLPLLKELECPYNCVTTGNISSLRVLKQTLEKVDIIGCSNVEGNFMDLADFPNLKELNLYETAVTGDIRDIGSDDFSSLKQLTLPKVVYGGRGYEMLRISDAPELIRAVYLLKKQRPSLEYYWHGHLSEDSPDWYPLAIDDFFYRPPFHIRFVEAGSRVGYRWKGDSSNPCEVNWLDPEPDRESSDYKKYLRELRQIESQVKLYRGFHQPPTQEEYTTLLEERW